VARHEAELDSFDVIEGLMFTGGRRFEVLTGISLHGGLAVAWPMPHGRIVFLRRTDAAGTVHLFGRHFLVDRHWTHRLVRAEVNLAAEEIRIHALRRRDPSDQPLLTRVPYALPHRQFHE
jgi:hypothetical protein